jgi:tRNA A-37 threonylcarbamoyl transferase component Bud32/tetratricopeptide (TPR) repeat protein
MRGRVEELFHEMADMPPEARSQQYAARAAGAETRSEVEALLAFDSAATLSFSSELGILAQETVDQFDPDLPPCGPYKLERLLGRGGMGSVYLAERTDGEIRHRVAVKLLRPGLDDSRLRERFLAERQILANLSHPNIALLLDAGHSSDRQPYLVMEYVDGRPIDLYALDLPVREKIRLLLKVCAAIGYLHRNLIVHRDLKPSNILVTPEGEPKLLDFGIARMLDLATDSTLTGMRMLTPDYASPEQVDGQRVSTASDIYSLGALLYKLLTGASPHRFETHSAEAMISSILRGQITPPSRLNPVLKGDLDMIVFKALRKEPQERYATVDQFAEDLENYLESRPIRARKGEILYYVRKFMRRHWLPAAAAGLGLVGLTAGLVTADRQRAIAQQRFTQVRQLSNKLFDIDAEARKLPGSTVTRQLIAKTSQDYLSRLSEGAQGDTGLALEVGAAYMRLARVQGVPISANLGQIDQADINLQTAQKLMRSVMADEPGNRLALLRSAQIAHDRMLIARLNDRPTVALMLATESEQWLEKFQPGPADTSEAPAILNICVNVADQFALAHQYEDALRLTRRGIKLARLLGRPAYVGSLLWISADVLRERGEPEQSLRNLQESVRLLEPAPDSADQDRTMNYVVALIYEGRVLGEDGDINVGDFQKAMADFERAFLLSDRIVHQDANNENSRGRLAAAGLGWADILRHSDARRSLEIYDHVLQHLGEIPGNARFRRNEVNALAGSSYALIRLGRFDQAKARLETARDRLRKLGDYPMAAIEPDSEVDLTLRALANLQAARGHLKEAASVYRDLLSGIDSWEGKSRMRLTEAVAVSRLYASLSEVLRRQGDNQSSMSVDSRRLSLWRRWRQQFPGSAFIQSQLRSAETVQRSQS